MAGDAAYLDILCEVRIVADPDFQEDHRCALRDVAGQDRMLVLLQVAPLGDLDRFVSNQPEQARSAGLLDDLHGAGIKHQRGGAQLGGAPEPGQQRDQEHGGDEKGSNLQAIGAFDAVGDGCVDEDQAGCPERHRFALFALALGTWNWCGI